MLELLNEFPEIKKLMDQKMNQLKDDVKEQWIEQGIEEGKRRLYFNLILETLSDSFGKLDANIIRLLKSIKELYILQILYKQTKYVNSLDAFGEIVKSFIKD
jgi:hypothetical protein